MCVAKRQTIRRDIFACLGDGSGIEAPVTYRLRISRAANYTRPVDSVALLRVGCNFDEPGFDHHLFGGLVDLSQEFADIADVAASFAEENGVGAFVYLRWILARELRSDKRRRVFRARVTELIAIALRWLGGPFCAGLNVIDIVDLIHEEVLGLHDDRDRLKRGHILQPHCHSARDRLTHDHVDLRLPREQPQHLADIIALKLANTDPAVFSQIVRLNRGSGRRRCGCRRGRRRRRDRRC